LVSDTSNSLVRYIVLSTASVTPLAGKLSQTGTINGVGTNAKFSSPRGLAISPDGTYALVADTGSSLIRLLDITTATVTTLAGAGLPSDLVDAIGTNAKFKSPYDLSISSDGVFAVVADYSNHCLRHIVLSTGRINIWLCRWTREQRKVQFTLWSQSLARQSVRIGC
jgi:DNA-binding beta-propeller fold protein YncE